MKLVSRKTQRIIEEEYSYESADESYNHSKLMNKKGFDPVHLSDTVIYRKEVIKYGQSKSNASHSL